MSKTGYYTGAEEISASSGDFSTTDSITPNYTNGWAQMVSDVFSVPSSGSLPSGVPGNSNDVDLSDANEVMLVTVRIKDINMLSATGVPRIPSYPFCIFPNDFNVLNDWSGVLYRGRNTAKIRDYDSEADAKADATLARPDTWVWYNGKWVSLIGNNPENMFYAYGTNSSGQTEYFQHITAKESGIESEDLRYVERARVRLSKNTISSKFVTTYNGTRCAMMLLIPFKATEYTPDAVGNASNFSNTQVFYAANDIGEKYYNVSQTSDIPTLEQDGTNWTRLPGFYSDYSPIASESSDNPPLPYFRKPSTYRYITAFNTDDTSQYEDISQYYGRGIGNSPDALNIMKSGWQPVYQRKSPSRIDYNEDYMLNGGRWIVWDGNGWSLNGEEDEVASTSKRLLGLIIQAPGGNGGNGGTAASSVDEMIFGGTGGGGGAYAELLINAYNNSVKIEFSTLDRTFYVSIKHNGDIFTVKIGAGRHGGSFSGGIGRHTGGNIEVSYNNTVGSVPLIIPQTQDVLGDVQAVPWYYSIDSSNIFSWETSLCGILAAIPGGSGGNAGQNGSNVPTGGNYFVTGVPNNSLKWFTKSGDFGSGNDPLYYGDNDDAPGKHPGKASLLNANPGGGGGGASYFGRGGNASGPTAIVSGIFSGNMYGTSGKFGGGGGGGGSEVAGYQAAGYAGGEGFVLVFR